MSLPTQYNGKNQDPVGALSSALARLQANRPLRELREVAKGITKQLPQPIQVGVWKEKGGQWQHSSSWGPGRGAKMGRCGRRAQGHRGWVDSVPGGGTAWLTHRCAARPAGGDQQD